MNATNSAPGTAIWKKLSRAIMFRMLTCGTVILLGLSAIAAAQGTKLTAEELAIWNDPEFQRQFIESYLSETDIEPKVSEEERETMQQVLDFISSDEMDEAARVLEQILTAEQEFPVSAVFDFTLANIYFQQDELDEAVPYYETAVEKHPKFRRAWKNLALIHVRKGRFDEALPALTRVLEFGGADSVTYGLLGYSYSSVENYLAAESAYRMAILLDPDTMDWKMGLAKSFFKQERYPEALALTGKLLEEEPDRSDLWLLQANAYVGMNQPLDAAEIYEIVDQLGASTFESLNLLGDIYTNEELYSLAANTYLKAIEREPKGKADQALRAAKILAARGAFDETRRILERIDELYAAEIGEEKRKDMLKLEARLAVAEGAAEEEVRVLEEIVALDPLDGEALMLLGQHSYRQGDIDQAVFYYERAANIEGFEAEAKVRHAQMLVSQGQYNEALPLLRRAQQIAYRENVQEYLEQVERVAKGR